MKLVSKIKLKNTNNSKSGINKLNSEIFNMLESMVKNSKEANKGNNKLADVKPSIILRDSEFGKY